MDENPYRGPHGDGTPLNSQNRWIAPVAKLFAALGIVVLAIGMMLPAVRTAREPARRNQCTNKLKMIAIALHFYERDHHALPPAYTVDADGKPLHSWRTLILPYLEERQLYETIDLAKPWDDPANAEAMKTVLDVYCCPSAEDFDNRTTYLAIVGPNCTFKSDGRRKLAEIKDDAHETLMIIEVDAAHAVPWMSPVDANEELALQIGAEAKLPHGHGWHAVSVDGSVRFYQADLSAAQRRALISIAGNDAIAAED